MVAGMSKTGTFTSWCVWGYLLLTLCLVLVVRLAGDQWWVATVLLFSPRWLFSLPLLLLVPLVARYNRWLWIPLALTALIIFVPFMGFNLPVTHSAVSNSSGTDVIRVLTLNVDTGKCNPAKLAAFIKESAVDVVALQEHSDTLKLTLPTGWQMISQRGLAIFSHFPLSQVKTIQVIPPRSIWPGTYLLHATVHAPGGDIAFCSLQLPTPRIGLLQVLDRYTFLRPARKDTLVEETAYRWRVAQEVQRYVASLSLPVIIAGDFNTPIDSSLYRQVWSRFSNVFSKVGWGYGRTQRVSIQGLAYSARIDHILTGNGLVPRVSEVGPDVGSDHLPLIADLARNSSR